MKTNHIVQALNEGKRIQHDTWNTYWIKKYSDTEAIDVKGHFWKNTKFNFNTNPNEWRIHTEDIETETPTQNEKISLIMEIDRAINLLKSNGYEVYKIEKIKL